ncbi:MAG: hypothetical protein IT317_19605 [Anaerolineales bacterium]|nr:hypothetical protein [Anaerolineales bacterium]
MPARAALVTLALGHQFRWLWRRYCRPSWQAYADRHGYDLICVTEPPDPTPAAAARMRCWQKLLVLGAPFTQRYNQVVWVDADVLINPQAPSITADVPPERVGAVDEYAAPSPAEFQVALARLYAHYRATGTPFHDTAGPAAFYGAFGLPAEFQQVVQTGVLVVSPRHHQELFEHVYHTYAPRDEQRLGEMRPLSYELLRAGLVAWLDPRFNFLFSVYQALRHPGQLAQPEPAAVRAAVAAAYAQGYFLHLAGRHWQIPSLTPRAARRLAPPRSTAPAAPLTTPVALFFFNRPELTAEVFAAIRAARPSTLLLVADGPRPAVPGEADQVAAARAVVAQVDWPCAVQTRFAPANLGLKARFDSGLAWVFAQVEQAIILEDDCLPGPDFFAFCQALLARYAGDRRVLSISGDNFQAADPPDAAGYYFSRYPHIWGWATWRRAWRQHDPAMTDWPAARAARWLDTVLPDADSRRYWDYIFQNAYATRHTWDHPWTFSSWRAGGLHIHPAANLVTNLGFGAQATHTSAADSPLAELPVEPLTWPLRHPSAVERWAAADDYSEQLMFGGTLTRVFQAARARLRRAAAAADPPA